MKTTTPKNFMQTGKKAPPHNLPTNNKEEALDYLTPGYQDQGYQEFWHLRNLAFCFHISKFCCKLY